MSACPACNSFGSSVSMNRRLRGGWVKRWRKCECGERWETMEIPCEQLKVDPESEGLKHLKKEKK